MTRHLALLAGFALFGNGLEARAQTPTPAPAPTAAPTPSAPASQTVAAAEAQVRTFLFNLQAGKTAEAVDGFLGSTTTPGQKPGDRENLLAQINAALQAYGPVISYEKARADAIGTMVIRQYYLVQHRDMVVRWEFDFVRTGMGWRIDYFAFDDQPRSWF
jgi:hypothetical protein